MSTKNPPTSLLHIGSGAHRGRSKRPLLPLKHKNTSLLESSTKENQELVHQKSHRNMCNQSPCPKNKNLTNGPLKTKVTFLLYSKTLKEPKPRCRNTNNTCPNPPSIIKHLMPKYPTKSKYHKLAPSI
jgi:hypothetical protein